jgi:hypothetical protein
MADTVGILDNSLATTQRTINSGFGSQVFQNSATDSSYSLDPTDTQDFFRVRLSRRSSVVVTLNNLTANADLEFYDSSGDGTSATALQSSTNAGTLSDTLTTTPLDPGDYYIRVFLPDTSQTTNYTLAVNTVNANRADLLWRNYTTGQNVAWIMNGTTLGSAAFSTTVSDPNWSIQTSGDMNGDGTPDYIWRNFATGQDVIWVMNGTSLQSAQFLPSVYGDWSIRGVADFTGDGNNDLLWRSNSSGQNVIWVMNGTSFNSSIFIPQVADPSWQIAAVGNFGNTPSPDIVWRNYSTGQNIVWMMNGSTYVSAVTIPSITDVNWRLVGAGDVNGDGQTDLVWRNLVTGQNTVWMMNGTTYQSVAFIATVADANWQVASVLNTPGATNVAGSSIRSAFNLGTLNLNLSSGTIAGNYSDQLGGSANPEDFYSINLSSATNLSVTIAGLSADANLFLIKDANGNGFVDPGETLQSASTQGSGTASLTQALSAGTYYIRISSAAPKSTPYQLTVRGVAAQQIDLQPDTLTPSTSPFSLNTSSGGTLPASVNISTPQTIKINYRVINSPFSVSNATNFRISFYLSRDNIITPSDYLLGTVDPNTGFSSADVVVNSLAPYNSSSRTPVQSGSFNIALPANTDLWWGGDQTYYVGMIIDRTNQVAESNEANNTAFASINITGTLKPDVIGGGFNNTGLFSIVSPSGTQTIFQPGQAVRVTGTIRNTGNAATPANLSFPVQFYISNSDFIDPTDSSNTKLLGTAYIVPIASKSSTTFDSNVTQASTTTSYFVRSLVLPDSTWSGWRGNGRYYIGMQLNLINLVGESDGALENNMNYGRTIGQFSDYGFFDVTGF